TKPGKHHPMQHTDKHIKATLSSYLSRNKNIRNHKKKTMKTTIKKLGLLIALLFTILPTSAYDFEVDGIFYNILSVQDMTCSVTTGDKDYSGHLEIPSEVTYRDRQFSVAEIWLSNQGKITSVTIPNSVTYIGRGSFGPSAYFDRCSSLEQVTIPNSVTSFGDEAFYECSSLKNLAIPNSVTSIGDKAFNECSSLPEIAIPNSVTSIGRRAFSYCSSLKEIEIPNSVTSIGIYAFSNCKSLKSIKLSDTLTDIPYGLFEDCNSLESLEIPGSIQKLYQYSYRGYGDGIGFTFENCNNLTNLRILHSPYCLSVGSERYRSISESYGIYEFAEGQWGDWTNTIKNFYIDRAINEYIEIPNLEKLEIGESITIVQVKGIYEMKNLKIIKSHALVPPELGSISNEQYMDMTVLVPEEALDVYKADPVWGTFWNLQGDPNMNGLESVCSDTIKNITGRYDISGNPINDGFKGIVIVRFSDGSTKKIIQK
ncbi:MAG: leucine-rich repeat domain-containing protein, partial [Allobaculum sp.]|nr:leucine-rich repeat domain-containing protein [Allobaculum sp.]